MAILFVRRQYFVFGGLTIKNHSHGGADTGGAGVIDQRRQLRKNGVSGVLGFSFACGRRPHAKLNRRTERTVRRLPRQSVCRRHESSAVVDHIGWGLGGAGV